MVMPRKAEHIDICLNEDVNASYNCWDDIGMVHNALPELDMADIATSVQLFGKSLAAPIVISAITGGFDGAIEINKNLAIGAGRVGVGLGLGSQRAAIEEPGLANTYEVIKGNNIPLVIGNIGAPQLIPQGEKRAFTADDCEAAMKMIDADVLAIHLNYLQEVVQIEGDTRSKGCLEAISGIADRMPVMVKETGAGLSRDVAERLNNTGIVGFDVGGVGGTSFSAVEYYRSKKDGDTRLERMADTFWDWGIPTPVSLKLEDVGLPMIDSGGNRNGLDIAKTIAMGGAAGGLAKQILKAATESPEAVEKELNIIISELKAAMFLTGSGSISELADLEPIVTGRTKTWLESNR